MAHESQKCPSSGKHLRSLSADASSSIRDRSPQGSPRATLLSSSDSATSSPCAKQAASSSFSRQPGPPVASPTLGEARAPQEISPLSSPGLPLGPPFSPAYEPLGSIPAVSAGPAREMEPPAALVQATDPDHSILAPGAVLTQALANKLTRPTSAEVATSTLALIIEEATANDRGNPPQAPPSGCSENSTAIEGAPPKGVKKAVPAPVDIDIDSDESDEDLITRVRQEATTAKDAPPSSWQVKLGQATKTSTTAFLRMIRPHLSYEATILAVTPNQEGFRVRTRAPSNLVFAVRRAFPGSSLEPIEAPPVPKETTIRRVPTDIPLEVLHEELQNFLGPQFKSVRRLHATTNGSVDRERPLPVIVVRASEEAAHALKTWRLFDAVATQAGEPRAVTTPTQCNRCWQWGHRTQTCRQRRRCVRCGSHSHTVEDCPKARDKPQCLNCQGEHSVRWAGCRARREEESRVRAAVGLTAPTPARPTRTHPNPAEASLVRGDVSYSQTTQRGLLHTSVHPSKTDARGPHTSGFTSAHPSETDHTSDCYTSVHPSKAGQHGLYTSGCHTSDHPSKTDLHTSGCYTSVHPSRTDLHTSGCYTSVHPSRTDLHTSGYYTSVHPSRTNRPPSGRYAVLPDEGDDSEMEVGPEEEQASTPDPAPTEVRLQERIRKKREVDISLRNEHHVLHELEDELRRLNEANASGQNDALHKRGAKVGKKITKTRKKIGALEQEQKGLCGVPDSAPPPQRRDRPTPEEDSATQERNCSQSVLKNPSAWWDLLEPILKALWSAVKDLLLKIPFAAPFTQLIEDFFFPSADKNT